MLASAGVEKINFVGGEPMLHPHIETWIVHAKSLGLTTSIVSNGTNINEGFLQRMKGHLDWIGSSIDASNDDLHADLGRGLKGDIGERDLESSLKDSCHSTTSARLRNRSEVEHCGDISECT